MFVTHELFFCFPFICASPIQRQDSKCVRSPSSSVKVKTTCVSWNRAPDKRGIEDNAKIFFLISQWNHMLWPLLKLSQCDNFNDRSQHVWTQDYGKLFHLIISFTCLIRSIRFTDKMSGSKIFDRRWLNKNFWSWKNTILHEQLSWKWNG